MEQQTRAPRCLMYYPWPLKDRSGALDVLIRYSRTLKNAGYRIDCYAPLGAPDSISQGLCYGVFENVFVAPENGSPILPYLESLGRSLVDPLLSNMPGVDETSMVSAGILVSISDYDVVGIHYTRCHALKRLLSPEMPAVLFTHDLDSLVDCQEELIFGIHSSYQLADEVSRLKPFNLITVVGPDDLRAVRSINPDLPVIEATFTANADESCTVREYSTGELLWISMDTPFHRFSFFWFWNKVWPKIRYERPECRLIIAGRISEYAVRMGAQSDPQVAVLGVVDDAERVYRQADILLAPYYFGLGIKTKIIEALAKGIPVATTFPGISNTRIEPGRDAIVSNDASEYAAQVINLISSPALRRQIANNGLKYVRKWHDPVRALKPFVEAFNNVALKKQSSSRTRASALRNISETLHYLVPWVVQRCRENRIRRIAVYGAGSHTRLLIPIWKALDGPLIQMIVESGTPAETVFMGYPVVSADRFEQSQVDAIVLSSQGYEQEMATICEKRWPELPFYSIWRPLHSVDDLMDDLMDDFENVCYDTIPSALYESFTTDESL